MTEQLHIPLCDVCGLEDRGGYGDGLGTCDCPHCEWCGHRWGSSITTCECDDVEPFDWGDE
jgi:hypothetical protein